MKEAIGLREGLPVRAQMCSSMISRPSLFPLQDFSGFTSISEIGRRLRAKDLYFDFITYVVQ